METKYFKTEEGFKSYANELKKQGFWVDWVPQRCACGESAGIKCYDKNDELVEVLIRCEACYNDNPSNQGE